MTVFHVDTKNRSLDMVGSIEIRIGGESVKHSFGRRVSMCVARKYAQHFLDVMTGEPSTFIANQEEN